MNNVIKLGILAAIILLLFTLVPTLILGLWSEFNPNNFKKEEVQSKVKRVLEEKYEEKFIVEDVEYSSGINEYNTKAYPVNKKNLNFEVYIPGHKQEIREDYQAIKQVNKYLIDKVDRKQYYYEVQSGMRESITEEIKNNEIVGIQIIYSIIENHSDLNEAYKKMDEIILELRNEGFINFNVYLLVVKKNYTMKTLENAIFETDPLEFIHNKKYNDKIVLTCRYQDKLHKASFSTICKK